MRVVCVSDVSVGYSSPQIPAMLTSLMDYYAAEGILFEPDQAERPPRHNLFPRLHIQRIDTSFHPHSRQGRIEYLWRASKVIDELRPDVLVVVCTYCLPVLFKLKHRPGYVIYYSVESIPFYGKFDMEMNQHVAPLIDVIIFPEENRALREVARFGFKDVRKVILYNCTNTRTGEQRILPPFERNGRIIYFGTIDRERTFADYFLHPEMEGVSIDLFGPVKASSAHEYEAYISGLRGTIHYCGHLDARELVGIRNSYSYSIVMWNPVNENQLFAAPNKFFESIADGVPPISAPHPQCKMLIQRYQCGILMQDWSFEAFHAAICRALNAYNTDFYRDLVDNCVRAAQKELNWDAQFEKLKPYLEERKV